MNDLLDYELASPYDDEIWERLIADTSPLFEMLPADAPQAGELLEPRYWWTPEDQATDQDVYVGDMLAAADIATDDAPPELLAQFRQDYRDWLADGVVDGAF